MFYHQLSINFKHNIKLFFTNFDESNLQNLIYKTVIYKIAMVTN